MINEILEVTKLARITRVGRLKGSRKARARRAHIRRDTAALMAMKARGVAIQHYMIQ